MQKRFKFRAYDKKTKKTYDVKEIIFDKSVKGISYLIVFDEDSEENYKVEDFILMQFTGETDKIGQDIYEGDIYVYNSDVNGRKYVVNWENNDIAYEGNFHGYEFSETDIIVIGNIYENEDILK